MESDGSNGSNLRFSVFTPFGYQSGSCGYCKDPTSSASYYVNSERLSVDHYQKLMDRSWRRSGKLLYLPDNLRSCCPHYAIRLPAQLFQPRRDQRQALHRWNRFVLGEEAELKRKQIRPKSREQKRKDQNSFDLVTAMHESELSFLPPDITPAHKFEVTLEPDTFTDEKYQLFEQYQRLVHHESPKDITKTAFRRFLCDSPLVKQQRQTADGKLQRLGSFHHVYRLDGELIAMAVLDLLPTAVSAVYFIYDVQHERHSFGKLSAMREAALALEDGYQYYYMGFYISCQKMQYKAEFKPQNVLDVSTHTWNMLDDELRHMMDIEKLPVISKERAATTDMDVQFRIRHERPVDAAISGESLFDLHIPGITPLAQVAKSTKLGECLLITHDGHLVPVSLLTSWDGGDVSDATTIKGIVAELVAAVGPEVAESMILKFG